MQQQTKPTQPAAWRGPEAPSAVPVTAQPQRPKPGYTIEALQRGCHPRKARVRTDVLCESRKIWRPTFPPPIFQHATWPLQGIDSFVLDRLEREGLSTATEASCMTLLRRVTLDLPACRRHPKRRRIRGRRISRCLRTLVDRLLASPRFGERMVWDWLDAARYADTNGYQGDPDAGDVVLARLGDRRRSTSNMPFDQFTVEQLAGDLLPQPDARADDRHRVSSQPHDQRRGWAHRRGIARRLRAGPSRNDRHGLARADASTAAAATTTSSIRSRSANTTSSPRTSIRSTKRGPGGEAGGLSNPVLVMATPEQERHSTSCDKSSAKRPLNSSVASVGIA